MNNMNNMNNINNLDNNDQLLNMMFLQILQNMKKNEPMPNQINPNFNINYFNQQINSNNILLNNFNNNPENNNINNFNTFQNNYNLNNNNFNFDNHFSKSNFPNLFANNNFKSKSNFNFNPNNNTNSNNPVFFQQNNLSEYSNILGNFNKFSNKQNFKNQNKGNKGMSDYTNNQKRDLTDIKHLEEMILKANELRENREGIELETKQLILNKIKIEILTLSKDVAGNYAVQKILNNQKPYEVNFIVEALKNKIYELTLNLYGFRVVQELISILK